MFHFAVINLAVILKHTHRRREMFALSPHIPNLSLSHTQAASLNAWRQQLSTVLPTPTFWSRLSVYLAEGKLSVALSLSFGCVRVSKRTRLIS